MVRSECIFRGKSLDFNYEKEIPENCIIKKWEHEDLKIVFCINITNSNYNDFLLTINSVYRNYFEIIASDQSYRGKASIILYCDGYSQLSDEFYLKLQDLGIFYEELTREHCHQQNPVVNSNAPSNHDTNEYISIANKKFKNMNFFNDKTDQYYSTQNVAHTFWKEGMSIKEFYSQLDLNSLNKLRVEG